jgi:hypothetical protein
MRFKLNFKSVLLVLVLVVVGFTAIYFYAYQDHRDIATEEPSFSLNAQDLKSEFSSDFEKASGIYANKTMVIYGNITALDLDNKILMLNESISILGIENLQSLKLEQQITIKGRLVGYDELLEEIVVDQSVIQ